MRILLFVILLLAPITVNAVPPPEIINTAWPIFWQIIGVGFIFLSSIYITIRNWIKLNKTFALLIFILIAAPIFSYATHKKITIQNFIFIINCKKSYKF